MRGFCFSPFSSAAFIFLCLLLSLFSGTGEADAAFGISPPFMNADHLVPGSRYSQTIFLVQDQPNDDIKIRANFEINERVRKWITVIPGEEFVIPKGVRQFGVTVTVDVPKDANLGVYSGTIRFETVPEQAGQVTIALGVQVVLNLSVGNNIFRSYNVPLVRILDIEEGWSPRVYVKFANEGNVPEELDAASFELFDKFGAVRLAYVFKEKDFPEIPPFSIKEFTIEFPIDLHIGVGNYRGRISLSKDGKTLADQSTPFAVLVRGSLSSPTAVLLKSLREHWRSYAAGGAILILGLLFLYRKKRRGRGAA